MFPSFVLIAEEDAADKAEYTSKKNNPEAKGIVCDEPAPDKLRIAFVASCTEDAQEEQGEEFCSADDRAKRDD